LTHRVRLTKSAETGESALFMLLKM